MILGVVILLILEYFIFRKKEIKRFAISNPLIAAVMTAFLIVLIILFGVSEGSQFIYFQILRS